MKKHVFLLIAMVAMMVTSVGMSSCSKDDDGEETVQSDLEGTWVCVDWNKRELSAALTFSKDGKDVIAHFEGFWFSCKVDRKPDSMTLTGDRITMSSYTDFGNFLAKAVGSDVTITFDYVKNGKQLDISNIKGISVKSLKQNYSLEFDKVYEGKASIIY